MNLWKKISLSVLIFVLLLLGVVIFLIGTTTGLHLTFNAVNYWIPGLEIGQVTGNWSDLNLKNIRYQHPGMIVDVGEFHLAMDLSCLFDRKFCLNDLYLKDANIVMNSKKILSSTPIKKNTNNSINHFIPYSIVFYRVVLNNINLKINDRTISVMNFNSGLRWQGKNLTLMPTSLKGLLIVIPKAIDVVQENIIESKIKNPCLQGTVVGEILKDLFLNSILLRMNDIHFPLNLNIEEFKGEGLRLTGSTDIIIFKTLMKLSFINGDMKIDSLNVNTNHGSVNITGNILLYDNCPVNITLNSVLNINLLKDEKVKFKITGALYDKLSLKVDLSGPVSMTLRGYTRPAGAGLPLDFKVDGKHPLSPFVGNDQFQSDDFKLRSSGKIIDYILKFHTTVKGQNIPSTAINTDTKGNNQQSYLERYFDKSTIEDSLKRKTELQVMKGWQPSIRQCSKIKSTTINTEKEISNWPLNIDGLIKARGRLYDDNWQIDISEINFTGNIRKNKVSVYGSMKSNKYFQWIIPSLHITLGHNTVDIKGKLGIKDIDLGVAINASNLGNAIPRFDGSVKGFIKARGTVKSPQLSADFTAKNLRWRDLFISCVQVNGNVKFIDQIDGKLTLHAEHIMQQKTNIDLITLEIKGNENRHDLQLYVRGDPISGKLYLIGSLNRQTEHWKGQIDSVRFSTPIGPLGLSRAISLEYCNIEKKISIGPHCWINPKSKLCVSKIVNVGTTWHAQANFNHFNLAIIEPFISENTQIKGIFNGKINVVWDATKKKLQQIDMTLSGHNVKITQFINDESLTAAFNFLNLNLDFYNNQIQLSWLVRLVNNGQFEGQVKVEDPHGQCNLSGIINIHDFNLVIANSIFSHGEKIFGLLNTNLRLAGNVQSPQLFGQIKLSRVNINGNFMPFDMRPSHMMMKFNGMGSTIAGQLYTSQGQIDLTGNFEWSQINNWHICVKIKGSRVRISTLKTIWLDISPDVEFDATSSLFTLTGSVDIPWAHIVVHDIPKNTVDISNDEVLLNEDLEPLEQKRADIPINGNLIFHMGDNVQLNAFGLKAKLTGDLKVMQNKQSFVVNGKINIPEGHFHAYGQDLIVHKGELLFSGSLDQPVLNIEAIRNPDTTEDDVIVGIRVTGPSDRLEAEIFSRPEMSKQEAISYLLRGQRLDKDRNNSAAMTSMLIKLGISKSKQVMIKIGEIFGVRNMALDTKGVGDSSQIVVSGYIFPGIQIEYGVRIFDALSTLTIRYRLMPKLYLEIISGINQALDLLYQFEF